MNFLVGCIHNATKSCVHVKPENVQATGAEFILQKKVSKYTTVKMIFCVAVRAQFKTVNLMNLSWL